MNIIKNTVKNQIGSKLNLALDYIKGNKFASFCKLAIFIYFVLFIITIAIEYDDCVEEYITSLQQNINKWCYEDEQQSISSSRK